MRLEITGLSAHYGDRPVLNGVAIPCIDSGAFVGVIGPNASGKSTLLKTLAGLVKPTAGAIRLGGEDITRLTRRERARRVAYMPQAFGCNALLTVFESVLLALKQTTGWRVRSENLDQVAATLATLGLGDLSGRGVADLSGGQAQMVAVAQTLVRAPDVILLDEPTSALDLHHQLSVLSVVRREAALRRPVVMAALHDLNLAAKYCDRLVLIGEGQIVADGNPENVLALRDIGRIYCVETCLERTARGGMYVDAHLPA
ncbi:MAG: ABC transporter ATP-binding protein [Rhodobacteraceae bacterium]|nr:ABC transporter ATP-binding protein [Paracoccaceae bacterium]MYF45153.1 ABC transporter ATP-binding protein [Paracoccaceae bacterium]MYI91346.1 ABC transporter ATP-binding protein [Paracoccaceae bacterium]